MDVIALRSALLHTFTELFGGHFVVGCASRKISASAPTFRDLGANIESSEGTGSKTSCRLRAPS